MANFSSDIQTYTNQYLDYSKISFEEVVYELGRIIKLESNNLQDFYRSSLGRRICEVFASTLNVEWKYLETQFRESFLASAQNYSSIISGANSLGYSIRRPTSSQATLTLTVSGEVGSYNGTVTIPKFSNLQYNGINFITLDDYNFGWDYNGNIVPPSNGATMLQGQFFVRNFQADEKNKFQTFTFNDPTFSNYFGEDDLLADDPNLADRITTVTVDGTPWAISKYSLYTPSTPANTPNSTNPYVDNGVLVQSTNQKCMIRTGNNGNIEILFGDGIVSAIPRGVIQVKYLSSAGSSGNVYNSANAAISFGGPQPILFQPNSITNSNLNLFLATSPVGGDDLESIDSIKLNASNAYASQDRFVNAPDYIAGLLTSPNVKYAMVYGEDQLGAGDYRYFNVVIYTVLKNLYITDSSNLLTVAQPLDYVFSGLSTIEIVRKMQDESGVPSDNLSNNYNLTYSSNAVDDQTKYNNYVLNYGSIFRLSIQDLEDNSELGTISTLLSTKGQLTCRHIYVPPKVHKFKMTMTIYTNPIVSKADLANSVRQDAYQYLKENTQFDFPIYNSKIVKIIESNSGIVGCHVYLIPSDDIPNDSVYLSTLTTNSNSIFYGDFATTMDNINNTYFTSLGDSSLFYGLGSGYTNYSSIMSSYFTNGNSAAFNPSNMTERNVSTFIDNIFKETLGRLILNPQISGTTVPSNITSIINNSSFNNPITGENIYDIFVRWAVQFRQDTNYYVANLLLTDKGDIANFSIPHEIAQVSIDPADITITTKPT